MYPQYYGGIYGDRFNVSNKKKGGIYIPPIFKSDRLIQAGKTQQSIVSQLNFARQLILTPNFIDTRHRRRADLYLVAPKAYSV
jgi:hypothetical protein